MEFKHEKNFRCQDSGHDMHQWSCGRCMNFTMHRMTMPILDTLEPTIINGQHEHNSLDPDNDMNG